MSPDARLGTLADRLLPHDRFRRALRCLRRTDWRGWGKSVEDAGQADAQEPDPLQDGGGRD